MLSAYYFRAHQYTFVPSQVDADLAWMAEQGTDAVVVGILEQDLEAAVENVAGIADAAHRHGMKLFITPSRWGNRVAGCPKVPSLFSAKRPDANAVDAEGKPIIGGFGVYSSVHHPDVQQFFIETLERCFELWPVEGVIWDEPKGIGIPDHSIWAQKAFEAKGLDIENPAHHRMEDIAFFDRVTLPVKERHPDVHYGLFIFGWESDETARAFSALKSLQAVGCDGRPWPRGMGSTDSGVAAGANGGAAKSLVDDGPRFVKAAQDAGKDSLFLIENHAVRLGDHELMERYLPEVLQQEIGHLIYYYYPRSCEDADGAMEIVARHVSNWKKGS